MQMQIHQLYLLENRLHAFDKTLGISNLSLAHYEKIILGLFNFVGISLNVIETSINSIITCQTLYSRSPLLVQQPTE